jgi:hypothetical protein
MSRRVRRRKVAGEVYGVGWLCDWKGMRGSRGWSCCCVFVLFVVALTTNQVVKVWSVSRKSLGTLPCQDDSVTEGSLASGPKSVAAQAIGLCAICSRLQRATARHNRVNTLEFEAKRLHT